MVLPDIICHDSRYDLSHSGYHIPDVNGWDIIRMLRTAERVMPVLLLTALGTIEHRVRTGTGCGRLSG